MHLHNKVVAGKFKTSNEQPSTGHFFFKCKWLIIIPPEATALKVPKLLQPYTKHWAVATMEILANCWSSPWSQSLGTIWYSLRGPFNSSKGTTHDKVPASERGPSVLQTWNLQFSGAACFISAEIPKLLTSHQSLCQFTASRGQEFNYSWVDIQKGSLTELLNYFYS